MNDLTPEMESFIAKKMMENKPYLLALEERVGKVDYGSIEVRLEVRGGVVEKVVFYEGHTWLKEKNKLDPTSHR